jgi:hypothetical protein
MSYKKLAMVSTASMSKRMAMFIIFISCLLVWQISCSQGEFEALTSEAKGVRSNLRAKEDSVVVDGSFDYSIVVYFTVENVGKDGVIKVSPWLSTSEGEWSRSQHIHFQAGESKDFKYIFNEPTVNAANMQYGVNISPEPSSSK